MEDRGSDPIGAEELQRVLDQHRWSRRRFLQVAGVGGTALSLSGLLAACRGDEGGDGNGGVPTGEAVKIGYVSPVTGPLSPFGEAEEPLDRLKNSNGMNLPVHRDARSHSTNTGCQLETVAEPTGPQAGRRAFAWSAASWAARSRSSSRIPS